MLSALILAVALGQVPIDAAQYDRAAYDRAAVDTEALRTRAGLDEDYRLAEMLIARTQQRRIEALRLQSAANEIEVNNARLREFLCRRFCEPGRAVPVRDFGLGLGVGGQMPLDPALYPTPLPYVPPDPAAIETDIRWRGAGYRLPPRRVTVDGNINVQVMPGGVVPLPSYRRQ